MFRRETRALRRCLSTGIWDEPDLSSCTLKNNVEPFLLISFILDSLGSDEGSGLNNFGDDGTPDEETRLSLETEVSV